MKRYFFTIGVSSFIAMMLVTQPIKAASLESEDLSVKHNELKLGQGGLAVQNPLVNLEEEGKQNELSHRILFLCTGNSCRSQIAEGWTRYLGKESVKVNSAGIKAHGINPRTILIMQESGIDITGQSSKVVAPDMIKWANLVITVCGDADESCPLLARGVNKLHWPLPDPAKAIGTDEEIMLEFRSVSNEIRHRVIELLATLK